MDNFKLHITEHACKRYINRYNPALASIGNYNKRIAHAKKYIRLLYKEAVQINCDNDSRTMFNKEYNLKFIVRNKRIITLYTGNTKRNRKKNKRRSNKVADKFIIISMPDGSRWKISYAVLLVRYMNHKGTRIRALSELDTYNEIPCSVEERMKLIRSELTWSEIRDTAVCIKAPRQSDYEGGWRDGNMEVVDDK